MAQKVEFYAEDLEEKPGSNFILLGLVHQQRTLPLYSPESVGLCPGLKKLRAKSYSLGAGSSRRAWPVNNPEGEGLEEEIRVKNLLPGKLFSREDLAQKWRKRWMM
jgi:hypothetical protein